MTKIACVIPARLASSRFPEKVLKTLGDKPLLQHIWQRATSYNLFSTVLFAIDAQPTADLIDTFGGNYVMTSPECPSGTDRVIELVSSGAVSEDIILNWQGDSPFISKQMLLDLFTSLDDEAVDMWTLKNRLHDEQLALDPNVAKVVTDANDNALYFSRSLIPFYRDSLPFAQKLYFKHIGLYAYRKRALTTMATSLPTDLEQAEMLEQLRFMHHGLTIRVHETSEDSIEVNTLHDLVKAEQYLLSLQL